jgi:hypothetical protein
VTRRGLLGLCAALAVLVIQSAPALAAAPPATALPSDAPLRVDGVEGSPAGIAWQVDSGYHGREVRSVVYSAFGGVQKADAGTVGLQLEHITASFSLKGPQLYLPQPTGTTGLDISTGEQLPVVHDCMRTESGCFAIDQVGVNSDYQYSYTDDATHTVTTYSPVLLDGTTEAGDLVFVRAVDDRGAVLSVAGSRGGQTPDSTTLDYLDFASGNYTVLDDTPASFSSHVAMDAAHVVWTHLRITRYLDRSNLAATPMRAAPPNQRTFELAINGDKLAYGVAQRTADGAWTYTVYSGEVGGSSFVQVGYPSPQAGCLVPVNHGDFAACAGTSALDYGLYRLRPGADKLGNPIARFGFAPPSTNVAPDDFAADGLSTPAVVSPAGVWSILGAARSVKFGIAGDIPTIVDNFRGIAQLGVFRPSAGTWHLLSLYGRKSTVQLGRRGDIPVQAHYGGQNVATVLAVFRPSNGRWYFQNAPSVQLGKNGDVPVPGHYFRRKWSGLSDEPAVFRPSNGTWHILGHSSVRFGSDGDVPVPGDYNGDGRTDLATYSPSTQIWRVRGEPPLHYGKSRDVPLTGDFDGDGRADIAVYRPSNSTWHVRGLGAFALGQRGDVPVEAAPYRD